MQMKLIDNALVIEHDGNPSALSVSDFNDKPLTIEQEPAYYVALNKAGLLERCVTVTVADRKVVAALVGNWIAEGFQPIPCDLKAYAKHVRNLVAANKPAKADDMPAEAPAAL